MSTAENYKALNERVRQLEQRRALLQAQEQVKQERKSLLLKELEREGVDINNLEAEEARLSKEIEEDYLSVTERVREFERQLKEAESGGQG